MSKSAFPLPLSAIPNTASANTVFAGPTSGGATTPNFRALVPLDMGSGSAVAGYGLFSTGPTAFPNWLQAVGSTIGVTAGKDRNRPAAAGNNIYLATDTGQTYVSDQTNWFNAGAGQDKITMDLWTGGFTDNGYLISSAGATVGPTMVATGYTLVVGFYVISLPGTGGGCIVSYGVGNVTEGWIFSNSATNSNKLRMTMKNVNSTASNELTTMSALTVGFHTVAIGFNGTNLKCVVDGGTVQNIACTGTFAPPTLNSSVYVGRGFFSTGFSSGWMRIGFIQGYASYLSDADCQAVSNNNAAYLPGVISTDPDYDWQARWIRDGSAGSTAVAYKAYGLTATAQKGAWLSVNGTTLAVKTIQ